MVNVATVNNLPIETGDQAIWPDGIVMQEDGWWPTGGPVEPENDGGLQNWQALQLGQRTEWLRFQLGGLGGTANSSADIDALDATGMVEITSAATGNPAPGYAGALVHTEGTGGKARQLCVSDDGWVYSRLRTDAVPTWTEWTKITPDIAPMSAGDSFTGVVNSASHSSNSWATAQTFDGLSSGLWIVTVSAGVTGTVAAQARLSRSDGASNVSASAGYEVFSPSLSQTGSMIIDGHDVNLQTARNDSAGIAELRTITAYGFKVRDL
ncbi:hypothetical protein [Maritimibacter sp. HL-12]|uniref:hypothetical protein n=1 Tax=Maritimibacter sp. HL-12 TaxID=1162418 RepID=UPI000A0F0714|nr:hypothetical protein [Maritimibacter sp. HL-12]SMH35815.1 hypothetical protein SAMN05661107_0648 [Maritimibacter sp. HL-12]